jgi:hypothetical protein
VCAVSDSKSGEVHSSCRFDFHLGHQLLINLPSGNIGQCILEKMLVCEHDFAARHRHRPKTNLGLLAANCDRLGGCLCRLPEDKSSAS